MYLLGIDDNKITKYNKTDNYINDYDKMWRISALYYCNTCFTYINIIAFNNTGTFYSCHFCGSMFVKPEYINQCYKICCDNDFDDYGERPEIIRRYVRPSFYSVVGKDGIYTTDTNPDDQFSYDKECTKLSTEDVVFGKVDNFNR